MLTTSSTQGKCSLNLKHLLLNSFKDETVLVSFQTRNIISCPLVLSWRAKEEAENRKTIFLKPVWDIICKIVTQCLVKLFIATLHSLPLIICLSHMSNLAIHVYISILNFHLKEHNKIILSLANLYISITFPLFGSCFHSIFKTEEESKSKKSCIAKEQMSLPKIACRYNCQTSFALSIFY